MKATKESDLITNKRFELNVITSGEEPLNENEKTHTGASRRTIEIYTNKIFNGDKASIEAHRKSKEVYRFSSEIYLSIGL